MTVPLSSSAPNRNAGENGTGATWLKYSEIAKGLIKRSFLRRMMPRISTSKKRSGGIIDFYALKGCHSADEFGYTRLV